jgi:hypothetical protein
MSKRNGESFAAFCIPECTYRQHDVYVEIFEAVAWSHVIVDLSPILMQVVAEEGTLTTPTQASGLGYAHISGAITLCLEGVLRRRNAEET